MNNVDTARIAVALALLWAGTAVAASDLLVNGGFEDRLDPWNYDGEWVDDAEQARTGSACVSGAVAAPNQSLALTQTVTLHAGTLYRASWWARSTNSNKTSLWIRHGDERWKLAEFLRVEPTWEELTRRFTVDESGEYVLEFVIPSSYGAAPGRVWVDDVSLEGAVALPAQAVASAGIHDFPALSSDGRGNVYLAWIESVGTVDRLRLAVGRVVGDAFVMTAQFDYDVGSTALESVVLEGTSRGAWGCVSAESEAGFDIHCFRVTPRGTRDGAWITRDAATDIHPALAAGGSAAWVVWESNRGGSRHIWTSRLPLREGDAPSRLSWGGGSHYFPAAAANESGHVRVVWSRAVDGQYDLNTTVRGADGWSPAEALTANPYLETRPDVVWASDGAWVAWEVSRHPGLRTGYADMRRVLVARIGENGLEAPADAWDAFPEWSSAPRLAPRKRGGVAVTLRTSQWERGNWNAFLHTLGPGGWTDHGPLGLDIGRNRGAPLVEHAGEIWAAVQGDNIEGRWNSAVAAGSAESGIRISHGASRPGREDSGDAVDLVPLILPPTNFDPQSQRDKLGEQTPRSSIEHDGETLNLYWGQLHEHSEISFDARRVDLPPDENYMVNRDFHRMDFAALTDHGFNMSPHIWNYLGKLARWQNDPGRFVTFLAQEWTSSFDVVTGAHEHGFYGHRNLILADPHYPRWFNAREGMTPTDVWDRLRQDDADFIQIPHQTADTGNVPTDWDFVDEVAQPLAEIFQLRGSYEHRGAPREARNTADGHFLQDAWNDGVIVGVIASPDHGGGMGKAAIYAPELTREALLESCRKRHTYGTTGLRIALDVRVNGALMGDKLPLQEGPVRVSVRVSAPAELSRLEVIRNGAVIHDRPLAATTASVDFTDRRVPADGDYYYVRIRAGFHLAWSSPVWFLAEPERIQRRDGFREPVDP